LQPNCDVNTTTCNLQGFKRKETRQHFTVPSRRIDAASVHHTRDNGDFKTCATRRIDSSTTASVVALCVVVNGLMTMHKRRHTTRLHHKREQLIVCARKNCRRRLCSYAKCLTLLFSKFSTKIVANALFNEHITSFCGAAAAVAKVVFTECARQGQSNMFTARDDPILTKKKVKRRGFKTCAARRIDFFIERKRSRVIEGTR
jgi:hypothetical protein